MDVESLAKELILKNMTPEQQMAVLDSVRQSVVQAKEVQKKKIGENVDLVVQALKKIESDIRSRFDDVGNAIEKRVSTIQDGRDGIDGKDGRDGKDGKNGRDGAKGEKGESGQAGIDGVDGVDGVSVTNAHIDFDGSLIITLSTGVEINVGEVVAPDLAERIKVITNGGGTSQSVLDTLASLQAQITALIPSQTGNSGKYLTTNGTALSWASIAGGGLSYQGTWNASTNTPTLASSTGVNGYYYIVSTAGSTNLDGITDWQIGDWLLFNGTVWQKIDQSETLQSVTSTDGSVTVTTTGSTADLSVAVSASTTNVIVLVRNATGATLTKGTAVYINGATGQNPTVTKAQGNNDTNSAQTLGLMTADLANNSNGYVTVIGLITNIDTSAFTDGQQLYLSPTTAGTLTATKPYAPQHLVYVAVVEHAHPTQGKLFVKVQNGYEMDELHNVSAQSPSNGQVLIYNASTSLWEKNTLTDGTGISITEGAGSITITNSAPDQTVALTQGGTTTITGTYPNFTISSADQFQGTVTSVTGTSPVASSGGATPAISLASGYGDTLNPYASKTANFVLAAPNGSAGAPTFRAVVAADIPTLNQSTTGSAATLTTARAIYGNNFDGSAALTQVIASTYGGTGNGFTKFTGATTAEKTYTLPDASSTIVVQGGALGTPSSGTVTNLTGTASININGTVGATTASSGAFTTLSAIGVTTVQAGTAALPAITTSGDTNTGIFFPAADTIAFSEGGAEIARFDSSSNLLFGSTSNPFNSKFYLTGTPTANAPIFSAYTQGASNASGIGLYNDAASVGIWSSSGNLTFRTNGNLASGSETMRIDSSGNLLVGTTSATIAGSAVSGIAKDGSALTGSLGLGINSTSSTGTQYFVGFGRGGTICGQITSTTTNSTSYVTSSDYRLKKDVQPMIEALAKVALLKPCTYKWIEDDTSSEGFIAHELAEICPDAVVGQKDAVNDDGSIKSQGIDTSFLVATLTAAIQEQQALIQSLTTRITALEAK
jgi:hypothetical protein